MPKISVIMPAYNSEKYIAEAIESILNQTYKDFEFIIINDGSIDRTEQIILSYSDSRIVYLKNQKNMGISDTLNQGLDIARGEYIARMDSDDISLPERFERQVSFLNKHHEIGVCGVATIEFGDGIDKEEKCYCVSDTNEAKASLIFSTCLAHPTVMIRAKILREHGLRYESYFNGTEDYLLWWKIAHYSDVCVIDEALFKYRIHKKQITQNVDENVLKRIKEFERIRLKEFGFEPTKREEQLFFSYCTGRFEYFDEQAVFELMDLFRKLVKLNKDYYPQKQLKYMFESATMHTISNLNIDNNRKKHIRRKAVKQGVITPIMCIKLIKHGAII